MKGYLLNDKAMVRAKVEGPDRKTLLKRAELELKRYNFLCRPKLRIEDTGETLVWSPEDKVFRKFNPKVGD